jgi:hypothetical protein
MEQTINETLEKLKLNSITKKKHETLLKQAKEHLKKERCLLHFLNITLNNEKQDVEQLEKLSLTSLYHSIVGNKREKLNIEQQEYITAKLKYDRCQSTINYLINDIKSYQNTLDDCEKIEHSLIDILKDKQQLTQEQTNQVKSIEKLTQLKAIKIELQQAIKVGVELKKKLKQAYAIMKSAGNWGLGDMLGGGLITTAIKHKKINNGKELLEEINNLMIKHKREINDVYKFDSSPLKLNITGFNTFADYFIDGLLFDWMVQSKINNSIKTLEKSIETTKTIQTQLYKRLDLTNTQLKSLD